MEEAKGTVKHIVIGKFKDDISPERIEELIKGYANLVNLIPPMKSFHWGTDVSAENMHQGFTHVFESTFESTEAIAEYVAHPAHVEYANLLLPCLQKAKRVWREAGLENTVVAQVPHVADVKDLIFRLLNSDQLEQQNDVVMMLWCLWKRRNDKVWKGEEKDVATSIVLTRQALIDWKQAQQKHNTQ